MPHATLKIAPGVDTNKTPALNEVAVSYSNLIRFMPDKNGVGLAQKIGGWTRYMATGMVDIVRALKAWADLEGTKYLAIGGQGLVGAQVFNATANSILDVTPRYLIDNVTPTPTTLGLTTTAGTPVVTFYANVIPNNLSYVFFPTGISLGNLTLYGPYDITATGTGFYTINVPDLLAEISKITASTTGTSATITVRFFFRHTFYVGQSVFISGVSDTGYNGTYTIVSVPDIYTFTVTKSGGTAITDTNSYGGTVNANVQYGGLPPEYDTTSGLKTVVVTLQGHGFIEGSTFNATISTTVGGTTVFGLYTVTRYISDSQFEIVVDNAATSTTSKYENDGKINAYVLVAIPTASVSDNYFYGGGVYGEGLYGSGYTPVDANGTRITSTDWFFDNWGSILVGSPKNGAIFYWQPIGGNITNLSYAPNSPVFNSGMFVAMPQRQIIAFGSSFNGIQDPLLIRWCDLEDFTVWISQANNQAGSYRIPTGSRIVGGMQAPQQGLIWTDLDIWSMTYIGQPFIYSFNKIGANAGLIAPKAAGQMGGVVYWMSQKQFFRFAGNGVEAIPCSVWDQVFQNFYPGVDENGIPYTDRIRCAPNSQFNEIVWYFPAHKTSDIDADTGLPSDDLVMGDGEINGYVKYNVVLNEWDYGYQHVGDYDVIVGRTAWIDQSILGPPIGAAAAKHYTPINDPRWVLPSGVTWDSGPCTTDAPPSDGIDPYLMYVVDGTASPCTATNIGTYPGSGATAEEITAALQGGQTVAVYWIWISPVDFSFWSTDVGVLSAVVDWTGVWDPLVSGYVSTLEDDGYLIYQHETQNDADGAAIPCGFTTGYANIAEGDNMIFIDQVWPDMKWGFFDDPQSATVDLTFYVTNYPGDQARQYGPYQVTVSTDYLSVRMRGRYIGFSVSSTDLGSFWRLGAIRYRFQPDGKF